MEHTTLVQHIRQQEKATPGATGEFTSLMNEIMVAAKIISLEVNSAGIGEDIFGLTGKINIQGEEVTNSPWHYFSAREPFAIEMDLDLFVYKL